MSLLKLGKRKIKLDLFERKKHIKKIKGFNGKPKNLPKTYKKKVKIKNTKIKKYLLILNLSVEKNKYISKIKIVVKTENKIKKRRKIMKLTKKKFIIFKNVNQIKNNSTSKIRTKANPFTKNNKKKKVCTKCE